MVDRKKLALVGSNSNLSKEIIKVMNDCDIIRFGRNGNSSDVLFDALNLELEAIKAIFLENYDVYIFNLGVLQSKTMLEQSVSEMFDSLSVNALFIIKSCEYIFTKNNQARIFIIGSESGRKGSYDTTYFLSKSMLRSYVRQRYLKSKDQQLVLISPSTIEDGRMTLERKDLDLLEKYRTQHPKERFLFNREVAQYLRDLIGSDSTYYTNTEFEINGGKFCRMIN